MLKHVFPLSDSITFFTFIHFSEDLVKYLHCAKSHRATAPRPLPMRKAPLLNVNCRSSHFLITLILNDVQWAPLKVFPFILKMVFKIHTVKLHSHMHHEVKNNCFCIILCVMKMGDIGLYCEKTVKSLFHSVECINRGKNGHMHQCECGILFGFSKVTAHFVT